MFAGGEESAGHFEMGARGRDDAEGPGGGQGVVQRGEDRDAIFLGDPGRLGCCDSCTPAKTMRPAAAIGINAGVFLAQGADADHRHFEFCGHIPM